MHITQKRFPLLARQPLSVCGQLTVAMLLASAVLSAALKLSVGRDAAPLSFVAMGLLVCALVVVTGVRWTPLLAVLINMGCIIAFALQPFVAYHLSQPKLDFYRFTVNVLLILSVVTGLLVSITAFVQNYFQQERATPRWLTSVLSGIVGVALGCALIGAISVGPTPGAQTGTTYTNGVPTVHMGLVSFQQTSITIAKGSKLLLVDDGSFNHVLFNGRWVNNQPQLEQQTGAPTVNNLTVNGQNVTIGPFVSAGTYHIYCSIHQGMMLTIIVQ